MWGYIFFACSCSYFMINVSAMTTKHHQVSDEAQAAFLEKVASLWPVAKGTLCKTRTACTYKGCRACASGRKHSRYLFTYYEGGKQRGLYVRAEHARLLSRAIENGHELERLMTAAGHELIVSLREEPKD